MCVPQERLNGLRIFSKSIFCETFQVKFFY